MKNEKTYFKEFRSKMNMRASRFFLHLPKLLSIYILALAFHIDFLMGSGHSSSTGRQNQIFIVGA